MIRRIVFERNEQLRTDALQQNLPFRGEGHRGHLKVGSVLDSKPLTIGK